FSVGLVPCWEKNLNFLGGGGGMKVTNKVSRTLVRMPLYFGITQEEMCRIFEIAGQYIKS
ncbi:hypothetical protein, partial [Helicobacter bilis]|uniref:hypothetical protein n=1 Tax=Helicobacter bilis TaxID=37372 RepID=UPI001B33D5FA